MHKIGIISDTHGILRPQVLQELEGCEAILHGGDVNKREILEELGKIAPVYVVRGNNDKEWAADIPESLAVTLYGIRFFMIHNKKQIPKDIQDTDIVVYGHSHKYEQIRIDGRLFLNPGSCGPRRFTQPVTMAVLWIEDNGSFQIEKIELAHKTADAGDMPSDLRRVIACVMKETDKGRTVKEIARRAGIREELVEQICRLYLTHPGVDVEGIIGKMR